MTDSPTRIRLNLISEIAFSAEHPTRPMHIFRVGTHTDSMGRARSYEAADIQSIVANFAAGKRKRPPITERHDFGRAVGRIARLWADEGAQNLYAQPAWNKSGLELLENEVYDGFSCELDSAESGLVLIGGSLTNYPAVDGLEAVTLEAPPLTEAPVMPAPALDAPRHVIDPELTAITMSYGGGPAASAPSLSAPVASVPAREDRQPQPQPTQGVFPMSEPTLEQAVFDAPPLPPINDPALQTRLDAYLSQTQAAMQQRERQIEARLTADFERRMLEADQRNAIHAYARQRTMTDTDHPFALPATAEELAALLLETPSAARGKWQALINRITTAGLVSFDEIGSSAGSEQADQWNALVGAKVAAGMKRVDAIKQTAKDHPALYEAQLAPKGGR